ncbi:MAG: homocysteine S-methyltransferase family protein [Treponema sp.]|nr:homocysteine S-methyltransferase family protein [Treponema sp.]
MKKTLRELLGKHILFLDGGSGSVLQKQGLQPGEFPETWNILHPDKIIDLHYNYYKAGSNIVYTNTFGAYSLKFPHTTQGSGALQVATASHNLEAIVKAAVRNANEARRRIEQEPITEEQLASERQACTIPQGLSPAQRPHFVALDIGPCGKLLKPMGDLDFEDAVSLFKETMRIALSCDGLDLIVIETMNDSYETKAAVIAAKEVRQEFEQYKDIPIFATTVYDESAKLLTGADPETMTAILEGLRIDAFGLNCSLGPDQMAPIVPRLTQAASTPIIVKPNAGLPRSENGKTVYDVDAPSFATSMQHIVEAGACIVGGCCGTTPEYICRLVNAVQDSVPLPITAKQQTVVSSYTHTVSIGGVHPPVLIGERINPTGKKKFKEALRNNDIPYIIQQGLDQEAAGAHVLDVNVGLPEIDEKMMMVTVMTELQAVTDIPLQLDTGTPSVMEAALRRYNGKALVNSVNGKEEIMHAVFPLVQKYGGVVIALTIDEDGIPTTVEGRMKIVDKIYKTAAEYGIGKHDIVVDPLAMAVSSDDTAAIVTLQTVKAIHDIGGCTSLGVSNISFGLPERELVTSTFFTMAMENGLSAAIMNPLQTEMLKAFYGYCVLKGYDKQCLNYIAFAQKYAEQKNALAAAAAAGTAAQTQTSGSSTANATDSTTSIPANTLVYAVIHGLKEQAAKYTAELLQQKVDPLIIINDHLIKALDIVGKGFEAKKLYLPQLLMSAEAAKSAFAVIKETLAKAGKTGKSKGKIIIATVKGDIHDIGKNIVKVLLENYDFTVIDLGKDVPPETIVERTIQDNVPLVGLSALMTTTVPSMEETIKQLREKVPGTKVCVGGAVMTEEYAKMIDADFYGKDAMATVKYAQSVFGA